MQINLSAQLGKLSLFSGCSALEMSTLVESGIETKVRHREVLYSMGETANSFAIVLAGAFKLVKSTVNGSDIIVFFATPGDVIAGLAMNAPGCYPVSAIAMGPSVVLRIPRQTFAKSWATNALIQQKMSGLLFERMSFMQNHKVLAKAPLAQKIANQIVDLIEKYSGQNGTILPIPLTRQEVADSLGASVESVIRIMSEWSQDGIMKTTAQNIEILKMDRLVEIMMDQSSK